MGRAGAGICPGLSGRGEIGIMVHYARYYRWLVVSEYLRIDPQATSVLDVGCDDGFFLSQISLPFKVGVDLKPRLETLALWDFAG